MKITLSLTFAFFFIISAGPSFGQTASEIMVSDTRDSNNLPGYYRHNVKFDFKQNSFIGLPAGTGLYSGMMSFAPWGDASGGWNYQLNFNHGGLYYRNGDHLGTWNSWQKVVLADINGFIEASSGSGALKMKPGVADHTFIEFYARSSAPFLRSGWVGYGNGGGNSISMANEIQNGNIIISTKNGNVGIDTEKPDSKLAVNGNIRAHEIKVETMNWPDYVFKPDYQLLPLSELERFVKTHNHLPEIPTASVIENDGLLLGEMNKKMIKKIEEMTLYIIDQQKLIEAQNKRLEKLEQLISKQNQDDKNIKASHSR